MAQLIKSNGETIKVTPKNGNTFTLHELQEYVGGYIEILRPLNDNTHYLVVNEDGIMKNLPMNYEASKVYGRSLIVGDAVLCEKTEIK